MFKNLSPEQEEIILNAAQSGPLGLSYSETPRYCAHCGNGLKLQIKLLDNTYYVKVVCPETMGHWSFIKQAVWGETLHTVTFVGWVQADQFGNFDIYTGEPK